MTELSWATIKKRVHERANRCCEYCYTCEINIDQALHVEHIKPNEGDQLENLCLACPNCNLSKSSTTEAQDPLTERIVPLFHPRQHIWNEHFEWGENYTLIQGLTSIGRATAVCLKMNRPRIVLARKRWVQAGLHPVK